jgi:DNA-binding GntR family transcriptional regulator
MPSSGQAGGHRDSSHSRSARSRWREGRIDAFFEANQEFHRRIQELANNRWLLSVIQDLRKVLKLSRLHSLSLEGRLQQSLEEHRGIMAAPFEAGDAVKAE